MDLYIRLVTTYLIEYAEDWSSGRCYVKQEIIQLNKEDRLQVARLTRGLLDLKNLINIYTSMREFY